MPCPRLGRHVRTLVSVPLLFVACETAGQEESLRAALDDARRENERLRAENEQLHDESQRARRGSQKKDRSVDGQVIRADWDRSLIFINRGRVHKIFVGMRFVVWRRGKNDAPEKGALIRVVEVDQTQSTARIHKWLNPRIPVEPGMYISNPFYDPRHGTLKVYMYGELKLYRTETVRQYLAETNAKMVRRLDDTVNVIVLGEPPLSTEPFMDEVEPELLREQARVERARRIREVIEKARVIGAVVVTEDDLRRFLG